MRGLHRLGLLRTLYWDGSKLATTAAAVLASDESNFLTGALRRILWCELDAVRAGNPIKVLAQARAVVGIAASGGGTGRAREASGLICGSLPPKVASAVT
jgi:hypothetical protein